MALASGRCGGHVIPDVATSRQDARFELEWGVLKHKKLDFDQINSRFVDNMHAINLGGVLGS